MHFKAFFDVTASSISSQEIKEFFAFSSLSSCTQSKFLEVFESLVTWSKSWSSCKCTNTLCSVDEVLDRQTFPEHWEKTEMLHYVLGDSKKTSDVAIEYSLEGTWLFFVPGLREFQEDKYSYFKLNQSYTMPKAYWSQRSLLFMWNH